MLFEIVWARKGQRRPRVKYWMLQFHGLMGGDDPLQKKKRRVGDDH